MTLRISYLIKLLLLLLSLVMLLETASYIATRIAIREAVTENARRELLQGGEVFAQLMQSRAEQLSLSVNVLTDDFGFKDAVASDDADTIRSALINHAARVKADIGIVINRQGKLTAATQDLHENSQRLFEELQREAAVSGGAYASLLINNKPYQFVISSVNAPLRIGMAGMGFEIKDSLSAELKRLTALDVSFISLDQSKPVYLSGTLDRELRVLLLNNLEQKKLLENNVWEIDGMMTLLVPLAENPHRLSAVLQVPLVEVLKPFAGLNIQLFWLTLMFSGIAAAFAFWLARSVTKPVRLLAESAKQIGAGFYGTPVVINSNDELGDLACAFVSMQHAIRERELQVRYQAEHDPLTLLANRSRVFPELESTIQYCTLNNESAALLVIDIRNFTQINDSLSQEIGDQILFEVGQRIMTFAQQANFAMRLGSDEFLLIVRAKNPAISLETATHLHQLFLQPIQLNELAITVDLSIGVALYPMDADSPEAWFRRANLALNYGRLNKQNTCHYQTGWDEVHLRRWLLLKEFSPALANQQITLNYQPKINLRNPVDVSAEALVRWKHPTLGFINPDEFIAVIESAGLVTQLTRWVLRTAIAQIKILAGKGIMLKISVNLSAHDLLVDDLDEYIHALLQEYNVDAQYLWLELTESALMREPEHSLRNLKRLEDRGITLSIDDFGTGYSSLSQLKKLPVSELKIDKSFILNMDTSADDQLIVRSTIELGHTMGLLITAEGVETEAVKQLLTQFGCDQVQGYLYSRPVSADAFELWFKHYLAGHEKSNATTDEKRIR